ncbi:MAG: hypothetical protein Q6373_019660 [Candidatus Sigynarchaeota archaeon]
MVITTVILGVTLLSIAAQSAASIKPALNVYNLKPGNADPAPIIDGVVDNVWNSYNSTVMPIKIGGEDQLLRVYTCVFNDFIYFGLQLRTSVHAKNESFAIACSNLPPGSSSVNDSVYSYSVAKIVRIDGKSWDWKIYNSPRMFSNWTKGSSISGEHFKIGFTTSNFTFYELRFGRQLPRPDDGEGDVNWVRKNSYLIKIFYGTLYGNFSEFYAPKLGDWTSSTEKITLTIPAAPNDPTREDIGELKLNEMLWKVTFFIMAGFAIALVGVYIVRTKARVKRI